MAASPARVAPMPRLALIGLSLLAGLLACAGLLLAAAHPAWAAPAAIRPYPGAAPCNSSLQACIDGANDGDTIVIAAGAYITSFTLNKPVSLTGVASNTVILQALAGQRVLTVTGAAISNSVVISGLTFAGGDLTGFSCPANCGGGLLLADSAQPLLAQLIITGNSAFIGGGVYAAPGSGLRMADSLVVTNTAGYDGGGVHVNGPAVLNGGIFLDNEVTQDDGGGGGLFVNGSLALTGTQFINNTSGESGGGVRASGAVVLTGGRFQDNQCTTTTCRGGGLYAGEALTLTSAQFISNTAQSSGGGAWTGQAATLTGGLFQGNACLLDNCAGGGLYVDRALALTGTQFVSNTSRTHGGGVIAFGAVLSGGLFQGNACTQDGCEGGGLISSGAGSLSLSGTQFISNTARLYGGGVSATDAVLNGGVFQGNQCTQSTCGGGGLRVGGTLALTGTYFVGNTAVTTGGGARVQGAAVLTGGLFQGNQCTLPACIAGGLRAQWTVVLTGTQFLNNTGPFRGGGLYADGPVVFTGGLFQGNQSPSNGGLGGGLYANDALTLTGTLFISNSATSGGGGLYLADGTGYVANALFADNSAASGGAAINLITLGPVRLVHTTIAASTPLLKPAVTIGEGFVDITNTLFANYLVGVQVLDGVVFQDYNLFSGVVTPTTGDVTSGSHSLTGAAGFANPPGGEYHLTAASDAIDAGTDAGVSVDFEGDARPLGAGFDIGYDEWIARLYFPIVMR